MLCLSKSSFLLTLLLYINPGYTRSTAPIPAANAEPVYVPGTGLLYPQPSVAGSVSETYNTKQWLTKVTIGTQTFNLILDTGSSDLWVYGPNVQYAEGVNVPTIAPHDTYTCVPDGFAGTNCSNAGTFDISYSGPGFGASGYFVHDQVNVAGAVVRGMPIDVATRVGNISQFQIDGILGMGFKGISKANPPQSSFMEILMPQLTKKLFTVDLVPTVRGNVANIEFGYINRTKANGGLSTTPVNNKDGSWKVDNISFIIGDPSYPPVDLKPNVPFTQSMLFDTGGSNYIDVDARVSQAYYHQIPGSIPSNSSAGGISYSFPCNAILPDLTLKIGNGTAIYRAKLLTFNNPDSKNMCTGPLISSSTAEGAVGNMGGPFFAYHFVVYNPGVPEISYAPWNGTYGSSTP